jgi:hypothetical protein
MDGTMRRFARINKRAHEDNVSATVDRNTAEVFTPDFVTVLD